ncbi:MAG: hypothetical protein A2408_02090 [Candidatus Yonathbacteria bacterium RIFOXYC1_FULL_52_10]|nr:MAG: hypothetical protein A2408_02090 [Candidatus Yonathbacteria bacterium RIFOXYC1_FULL_52_10]
MNEREQYMALMSEIIQKQIVILGPEIAVLKARNVPEISIENDGKVADIKGDPGQALEKLIDTYVELSGQIVRNALGSIFTKYPAVSAKQRSGA